MTQARCAFCQSDRISAPTEYNPVHARVGFDIDDAKPGWLETTHETFTADRARICLDCGHVMLFVDSIELARLRERVPHLRSKPEIKRP